MPVPTILVVDDQPINVQLLKRKLEREGIRVVTTYNGLEALDLLGRERPDLILLDVMMPDMHGFEVCQRLQANQGTRSIPVIFITARTSKEGQIEGLGVGAVDYITKPIELDETYARVQTHLRYVAANREMLELKGRLVESRRTATIGAVTQGTAHNLNNLLGVFIGYLDLLKSHNDKPEQVEKNTEHVDEPMQRIVAIIKQLSQLVVTSRPPLDKVGVQQLLENSVNRFKQDNGFNANIVIEIPAGNLLIDTNTEVENNGSGLPLRIAQPSLQNVHQSQEHPRLRHGPDDGLSGPSPHGRRSHGQRPAGRRRLHHPRPSRREARAQRVG